MKMTRRDFLPAAGASLLAGYAGFAGAKGRPRRIAGPSAVAIVKAASYSDDLVKRMLEGVRECGLDVRGQRVLLKPNLVEFDPATCINTEVSVVAAAYEVFKTLGAAEVIIGEGPGHRRDTYAIAEMARYRSEIPKFDSRFVDLNRDDVSPMQGFADRGEIYLPNTALRADLIVSLAKMKTHHWAAATLSMKNFFGLVPGCVYGWPKNELHFVGIDRSIVELSRIFRRSFAIVDGIIGMEGNGPIQGTPKKAGVLVMGSDLPAVDATCCRIMGIDPAKVEYLRMASDNLGVTEETRIEQRGEPIRSVQTNFSLIAPFRDYRLA
ncbi:MAG TPA: DUF362 domain-containing protein [Bryobacteraceae bacterium]|nr:DUF362 domain-containing protein [Bryobacteraceae bacterium]